jgi:hypothetical protein
MAEALIAVLLLAILATVVQVVVPRIGEHRIERRLTENGGDAFVVVEAMPALRLLARSGDRLMVRGRGLEIRMSRQERAPTGVAEATEVPTPTPAEAGVTTAGGGLAALDGFREVDIALSDFRTGPFYVAEFELSRSGGGPYLMRSEGTTSSTALAQFGNERLGGIASPLLGVVAAGTPAAVGERAIAVAVEVELISDGGRLVVASGGGRIAGYPAGRIASAIAAAVARRLEISP